MIGLETYQVSLSSVQNLYSLGLMELSHEVFHQLCMAALCSVAEGSAAGGAGP